MPNVDVNVRIRASVDEVWQAINDLEAYPEFMENVREVRIEQDDGTARVSSWSVYLKGSILEWTEHARVDADGLRVTFEQLDGDLDVFSGYWQVSAQSEMTEVELSVQFEIGIPLLADMLNPVAARALRENSETMLREIERRVAITGGNESCAFS